MADPNKVTVYCDGYLTSGTASELAAGAYGTVILPLPLVDDEMLRQNIQRLKETQIVRNVLFGLRGNFRAVIVNKAAHKSVLAQSLAYYGADGIELDPDDAGPKLFDVVVELTAFIASLEKKVVASPTCNPAFWVEVLKATGAQTSWWNLQLNHGCDYGAWVCALAESGALPSEVAQSFVVPGYHAAWSSPDAVAYELEGLRLGAAFLDGVFLRRWEDVKPRAAEWGKAVWNGLGTTRAEAERPWRALVSA